MTSLRDELTAAVSLPDFLSTHEVGTLSIDDRRLIVQQALLLLEQNYAHLPFKVARYGINPLQRLRLMQARLGRSGDPGPDDPGPEVSFHAEMVDIYNSLHDLHTRYTLPRTFFGRCRSAWIGVAGRRNFTRGNLFATASTPLGSGVPLMIRSYFWRASDVRAPVESSLGVT